LGDKILKMLNVPKLIEYWVKSSADDLETSEILLEKKKYVHGLFFCHLAIEKIIKAVIVKTTKEIPPRSHDLFYLSQKAEIQLPDDKQQIYQILMKYQLEGRYPESFPKNPDTELVHEYFEKTKALFEWLKTKL
jgi:HEPN domain-containing protein